MVHAYEISRRARSGRHLAQVGAPIIRLWCFLLGRPNPGLMDGLSPFGFISLTHLGAVGMEICLGSYLEISGGLCNCSIGRDPHKLATQVQLLAHISLVFSLCSAQWLSIPFWLERSRGKITPKKS